RLVSRSRAVDDQPVDAEIGVALHGVAVGEQPLSLRHGCDADLEIFGPPAGLLTRGAYPADRFLRRFDVERESVPAFGQARGPRVRLRGVAAEDDFRMRLLHRLRPGLYAGVRNEAPREARLRHRPDGDHRAEILFCTRA